ncbi:hypothetical protein [Lactobacillus sp. M0396]|uniref:hypothetical protein n=1 Tax=Lactobacillus sp. M0396 TaxID=2751030 RepID=UPI0018DCEEC7|nr:hypothetical protein [Lactobacillus sp. M0396]MBI0034024.1 hypothetical protein [Lactobacillus sp. M0396]
MRTKEEKDAWRKKLVADAEEKILKLRDTDKFKKYLSTMAKFPAHSLNNVNLIYAQYPEAGYRQWEKDFDRHVKKGSKAIRISAPIRKKLIAADKIKLKTTSDYKVVVFRYVPNFDIKQTEGKPVMTAHDFVKTNLKDHKNVTALLNGMKDYLEKNTEYKVSERSYADHDIKGELNDKNIYLNSDVKDDALKLKTLYHEYAHGQLGHKPTSNIAQHRIDEMQAEAVAYVAMQNNGVDTGNYSLGYIATWAKDDKMVHKALSEIHIVSSKAIDITEQVTKELGLDKEPEKKAPEYDKAVTQGKQEEVKEIKLEEPVVIKPEEVSVDGKDKAVPKREWKEVKEIKPAAEVNKVKGVEIDYSDKGLEL